MLLTEEELRTRAKTELNEDPNRTGEDIEALRRWITKQPHIHGRTDDATLLQFLRNCKFSLEGAKKKIDNYYTAKTVMSEFFSKTDPRTPYMQELIKSGCFVPLGYDHEGRRILFCRLSVFCREKIKFEDLMRLQHVLMTYVLFDEQTQICGASVLIDYGNVDTSLLNLFTPTNLKKDAFCLQDCIPVRLRLIIPFNAGAIFDILFGIVKVFLKKKLLDRFRFPGSNLEALHSIIPAECLPTEYGGTAGDLQYYIDKTTSEIMSLRDYFVEDEKYFVIESKRIGKQRSQMDLFGTDGSFRKLNVD